MFYRTAPFSMTLNDPYPRFQGHLVTPFFDAEYFLCNTNRDLHTPYSTVSFRMTLSDLEWFSDILNDPKRRAVSLRQQSFLSGKPVVLEIVAFC